MNAPGAFREANFRFIQALAREMAGLRLVRENAFVVDSRLYALAREQGLETSEALIELLRRTPAADLHRRAVEAIANNETLFFRDVAPFEVLAERILPPLLARDPSGRSIRLWSAACATGQEAYSLALLLRERFPAAAAGVSLLASDFSRASLARARRGAYTQLEVNRGLPAALLVKYFERDGLDWRIRPDLRDRVEFREINLVRDLDPLPAFDVVLLRNMLIYVDLEERRKILGRIRRQLKPDGVLILGASETTHLLDDAFLAVPERNTCYYRLRSP